ncbi:MAG: glycosyltransferase [Labilithrix sp.]|nr:glycosyltransferase [Labilithrix sp.]MCW5813762.1 glycosyltransferase [Labilithrix sp.]
MRIAEVVLSLDIGGQERLLVRMCQALRERGHDVHVVTLTGGGALRSEVAPLPIHDVVRRDGFDPTLYARLFRLFRRLRPDVVHTHNAAPLSYAAPAARLARVPRIVHTRHGHIPYTKNALRLARVGARCAHHFVAVAQDTADIAAREERPPRGRLTVIENGIPLGKFRPDAEARAAIRAELGIPPDAFVVGTVGRLVEEKDYPHLVRSLAPVVSDRFRLVIVGEGGTRGAIEAAIDPAARPFVTLTGARPDVPRLLASFDVFALSSKNEGLPLVIAEAMATELPIVATAVGGIPDVVPSDTGLLVPSGDAAALRGAVQELADDESRRRRLGEAARAFALRRFAEERMLDRYLSLYGDR